MILAILVAIAYTLETANNNPVVDNQDLGIMAGTVSKSVVPDLNLDNFFFKKYKKKKKGAVYILLKLSLTITQTQSLVCF